MLNVLPRRAIRLLVMVAALAGLGFVWQLRSRSVEIPQEVEQSDMAETARLQWEAMIATQFAGDAACQSCHPSEFEAHQRSGHSQTAFRMEQTELAARLDGVRYTDAADGRSVQFALEEEGFFAEVNGAGESSRQRVDWLLGSASHAQTAVSIKSESNSGLEHCWTWFAHQQELGRTPGQPDFPASTNPVDSCSGRLMSETEVVHCFACHMTFGPAPGQRLSEIRWQPNISCERCHGPRRLHVEAARNGRAEEVKPLVPLKDPQVEMALCAQCHRGTEQMDSKIPESDSVRFQPYRLEQSRCFQANPSALTCVTCHDPHDKTSQDLTAYRQTCLSCHSQPEQVHCGAVVESEFLTADCISCHMPKREWSGGIQFVDHWIRVVSDSESKP